MRLLFSLLTGSVLFAALFLLAAIGPERAGPKPVPAANPEAFVQPEPHKQEALPQIAPIPVPPAMPVGKADLIRVDKSERRMQLLRDEQIIATYAVALGDAPDGPKQKEGDERTPEGRYTIDWRNPKSRYFLSLHISYPNANDKARAKAAGVSPGGDIMIHGQPNGYDVAGAVLQKFDWTDGCVAVTNDQMQQIWDAVPDGTPIEITP